VRELVLLELSTGFDDALDLFRPGGLVQGRDKAGQGKDQHEPEGQEKELPRGQTVHHQERKPELRVEHQDVAVEEQRVSGPEGEEHGQPPEVGGEDAGAPCVGALQLHREAEAEQDGEQCPRLRLEKDAHDPERQLVGRGVPGDRVGAEAVHVHQQHAEQSEAADYIDLDDARGRGNRPSALSTQRLESGGPERRINPSRLLIDIPILPPGSASRAREKLREGLSISL